MEYQQNQITQGNPQQYEMQPPQPYHNFDSNKLYDKPHFNENQTKLAMKITFFRKYNKIKLVNIWCCPNSSNHQIFSKMKKISIFCLPKKKYLIILRTIN